MKVLTARAYHSRDSPSSVYLKVSPVSKTRLPVRDLSRRTRGLNALSRVLAATTGSVNTEPRVKNGLKSTLHSIATAA